MNGDAAYGLFAQCVIVATAIRFVRELRGHARVNRFGLELWIPSVAMLVVSIEGVSLAGHLRGLWGDPSIVTFVLLMLYTVRPSLLPDRPLVAPRCNKQSVNPPVEQPTSKPIVPLGSI